MYCFLSQSVDLSGCRLKCEKKLKIKTETTVPTTDQPGSRNNLFIWKMRARSLILVISYQIPRFCCRLWGTVSSPILVRFYIFLMFWKATMLIHSFLVILSPLATLGYHPTTELKKCVFFSFFSVLYFWDYKWWWVPTPEMRKNKRPRKWMN